MKTFTSLSFFIVCIILNLNAQNAVYSRIAIEVERANLLKISQEGFLTEGYFDNNIFITELNKNDFQKLEQLGVQYKVLIDDVVKHYVQQNIKDTKEKTSNFCNQSNYNTPTGFGLGSMGGYYTYNEILAQLDTMFARFPQLITAKAHVDTFNTIEGRPVFWVRISNNPNVEQNKKKILYTGLVHAREPASMQQLIFYMYYILENYNQIPLITYIVDNFELYFIPCANPDGYVYNEQIEPNGGGMWRKNRRDNGDGSFGVDLNRNFGYMWGFDNQGSSANPSNDTYRGTAAFSEPESRLLKSFCERFNFSIAINNHTFSNFLLYPFGYQQNTLTPDSLTYLTFSQILTSENKYPYGTPYDILGYLGNGDVSDWMYGEQTTKDKILSFTPEIGAPAYGFWPPSSEIINICKANIKMNIYTALLAGKYAHLEDLSNEFLKSTHNYFMYAIQNVGLDSAAQFVVSITPISTNIESIGAPKYYTNLTHLQKQIDSIQIVLYPNVNIGEEVVFVVCINNGNFLINDTITKYAGKRHTLFFDPSDNLNNWQTTTWGVSNLHFFSAPSSITDSPFGNYSANTSTNITTSQAIDLTSFDAAIVEFKTKWDLAASHFGPYFDYVQLLISTDNGLNWEPLCGKYSTPSNNTAILGQAAYELSQPNWVLESIDLKDYVGGFVKFKFNLFSDWFPFNKKDGFYFDDFTVYVADSLAIYTYLDNISKNQDILVYPNPTNNTLFVNIFDEVSYTVKIYDMHMKEVYYADISKEASIETKYWAKGMYYMHVFNKQESKAFKKIILY